MRLMGISAPVVVGFCAAAALAQASSGPVRFLADSLPRGRGSYVQLDTNPMRLTGRSESPSAVALLLPRDTRFDARAIKQRCSPAEAAGAVCPHVARIGFGHAIVHASGYLFPGGQTDAVAYFSAFLAPPRAAGDRGSVVLQVRWGGADQLIAAANKYFGSHLRAKYSVIGRINSLAGRYGLEISFSNMPGGIQVPAAFRAAGVSVTMTRFKLMLGRVRRIRVPVTRVVGSGPSAITVHDHVLVGRHLIRHPASCPGSGRWPWQLRVRFPDGQQRVSGSLAC